MECVRALKVAHDLFRSCAGDEAAVSGLIGHLKGCPECLEAVGVEHARASLLNPDTWRAIEREMRGESEVRLADGHYSAIELIRYLFEPVGSVFFGYVASHLEKCQEGCGDILMLLRKKQEIYEQEFKDDYEPLLKEEAGLQGGE